MISTLIRHSDLSSRHFLSLSVSSVCVSCVSFVMFPEICERNLSVTNASMREFCLWFVTGFSSQSLPQPCFCICVDCEKKRQLVFVAFVSEFLFFLFFFLQGKKKTTKTKKRDEEAEDDEEEETRRTREWF